MLQQLCQIRDSEAERIDRPSRSIMSDAALIEELSRRPPHDTNDIQRVRGVRPEQVRMFGGKSAGGGPSRSSIAHDNVDSRHHAQRQSKTFWQGTYSMLFLR